MDGVLLDLERVEMEAARYTSGQDHLPARTQLTVDPPQVNGNRPRPDL